MRVTLLICFTLCLAFTGGYLTGYQWRGDSFLMGLWPFWVGTFAAGLIAYRRERRRNSWSNGRDEGWSGGRDAASWSPSDDD